MAKETGASTEALSKNVSKIAKRTFFGRRVEVDSKFLVDGKPGKLIGNVHVPPDLYLGSQTGDDDAQDEDGHHEGKKFPAVVLIHGLGASRYEHNGLFLRLAAHLALSGFIALRLDMRGSGESCGTTRDISVFGWIEDTQSAMDYLKSTPVVDPDKVALLGLSIGGLVAAGTVGVRKDVAAMVMWEAPFNLGATMIRLFGPHTLSHIKFRGYFQAGLIQLGVPFFEQLEKFNPGKRVQKYDGPSLIVQGSTDWIVPPENVDRWKEAFEGRALDVHTVEGGDHAFTKEPWSQEAINKSTDWLKEKLDVK